MSTAAVRWLMVILLLFAGGLLGSGLSIGLWSLLFTIPALIVAVAAFVLVWLDVESLTVTVR